MEQGFVDILKQLVKEQGNVALTDAKKCKALLADYTKNEYKKESLLLFRAVESGITKAIDGADDLTACKKAKIRDLEEEQALNPVMAADIVDTLALVLRGDTSKTITQVAPSQFSNYSASGVNIDEAKALFVKEDHDETDEVAWKKAFKMFEVLAGQGNIEAQGYIGNCYYTGKGVESDEVKSVEWWLKAAEQGDSSSQFIMGSCYQYGKFGITQDYQKAEGWYKKAADQGIEKAKEILDSLMNEGKISW
jgi:TPR repeat protein